MWEMNNRPVRGRSSETQFHPIDMNNHHNQRKTILMHNIATTEQCYKWMVTGKYVSSRILTAVR
jgi:hypothetical protein